MHGSDLLRGVPLELVELDLPIRVDKLIYAHEAPADPHDKLVVHDFRQNLFRAKHIEAFPEPCYGQLNPGLVNVARQHLVHNVALDRLVSAACRIMCSNLQDFILVNGYFTLFLGKFRFQLQNSLLLALRLAKQRKDQIFQQSDFIDPVPLVLACAPQFFIQGVDVLPDGCVILHKRVQVSFEVVKTTLLLQLLLGNYRVVIKECLQQFP